MSDLIQQQDAERERIVRTVMEFLDFAVDEGYTFGYWDTRLGHSFFESPDDEQLAHLVNKFTEK